MLKRGLPSLIPLVYLFLIALISLAVNGGLRFTGRRHPNFSPVTIAGTFVLYYFSRRIVRSFLIGVIWSAWHYPLSLLPVFTPSSTPEWVFFLSPTALAVIMTYIYNRTGANLLGMLLLHTFENITVVMFPPELVNGILHAAHEAWFMAAVAIAGILTDLIPRQITH